MIFTFLSYLDGIVLDWLDLLRALLSARWILHSDKKRKDARQGEAHFRACRLVRLRGCVIVLRYNKANPRGPTVSCLIQYLGGGACLPASSVICLLLHDRLRGHRTRVMLTGPRGFVGKVRRPEL